MKIGFAITAYDKFEEARILIEIIRKEFKGDYKISFCSNHPGGEAFAKENDIDAYVQGRDIPYFQGDTHVPKELKDRISIVLRVTDTVQKSCMNAMTMDVDYIIHMHSDAWVLSEDKLIELVRSMIQRNKKIAIRFGGEGLNHSPHQALAMDDHFFVFEKKFALENKIFDFKPEFLFPENFDIHEMLFFNIWIKAGLENIWCYRWNGQLVNYDDTLLKNNTLNPVGYDPYYEFLHVHRGSLPDTYGEQIQARYLKECGFSKSDFIQQFINQHLSDNNKMLKELKIIEDKLDSKLKFWGFDQSILENREIIYKQKIINSVKAQDFLMNRVKARIKKILSKRRKTYTDLDVLTCYGKYFKNIVDRRILEEFLNITDECL